MTSTQQFWAEQAAAATEDKPNDSAKELYAESQSLKQAVEGNPNPLNIRQLKAVDINSYKKASIAAYRRELEKMD